MNKLTNENINEIKKSLEIIINDKSNIVDGWSKDDIYQFIDDESYSLLINYLDDYNELDEQELRNDFYDIRRDAQEELCAKNNL